MQATTESSVQIPLELELQVIASYSTWVLGTELKTSPRADTLLTFPAISQALAMNINEDPL